MSAASYDLLQPEDAYTAYYYREDDDEEEERTALARANVPAHTLYLEDVRRLDSLRRLLDALLTPQLPLRHLKIRCSADLSASAVLGCERHLSGLTGLKLAVSPPPSYTGLLAAL